MSSSDYHTRTYVDGDETSLLSLFNKNYGRYAGFVPRTLQHWLWCCRLNPDISSDGIFVACKGNGIVGYAVIGRLSQKEGSFIVYELCYDLAHDGEAIVSVLLKRITQYANGNRGNYVVFSAPSDDTLVREACGTLSFRQNPLPEVMIYVILDMTKLVESILKGKGWKEGDLTFLIRLKGAASPKNIISIRWKDGELSVSNKTDSDEPKATIYTNFPTLSKLIFGGESILNAMLRSRLTVEPFWRFRKCIRLLSFLSLRDCWYIPRLDQI